jgi:hypothetical protein
MDGDADEEEEMILASKVGLGYREYLQMDSYEFACWCRGYELRKTEDRMWMRFFISVLLQPHSKKSIDPTKIIKFPHESKIPKAPTISDDAKKQMEEVFRKWDEQERKAKVNEST